MRKLLGVLAVSALLAVGMAPASRAQPASTSPRVEAYVPPKPGTRLVYRTVDDRGAATESAREIVEMTHQGKPVIAEMRPDRSSATLFDRSNGHWIGELGPDANVLQEASPPSQNFQWPLVVGASWSSNVTWNDRAAGRSFSVVTSFWTVEAVEDVTVPAGTFRAFRLQSRPGQNAGIVTTRWYAPELGVEVRRIATRGASFYGGAGRSETVLVSFQAPN